MILFDYKNLVFDKILIPIITFRFLEFSIVLKLFTIKSGFILFSFKKSIDTFDILKIQMYLGKRFSCFFKY